MNDTQNADPVAAPKKKKRDKTKKGMVHPTLGQHRAVLLEAEEYLGRTFEAFTQASKSRKAYTEWAAWEWLRAEVVSQSDGLIPFELDVQSEPALYAAVTAVRAYLEAEQAKTEAGARRRKQQTND